MSLYFINIFFYIYLKYNYRAIDSLHNDLTPQLFMIHYLHNTQYYVVLNKL